MESMDVGWCHQWFDARRAREPRYHIAEATFNSVHACTPRTWQRSRPCASCTRWPRGTPQRSGLYEGERESVIACGGACLSVWRNCKVNRMFAARASASRVQAEGIGNRPSCCFLVVSLSICSKGCVCVCVCVCCVVCFCLFICVCFCLFLVFCCFCCFFFLFYFVLVLFSVSLRVFVRCQ